VSLAGAFGITAPCPPLLPGFKTDIGLIKSASARRESPLFRNYSDAATYMSIYFSFIVVFSRHVDPIAFAPE
jgi:hypothetical protein